MGSKMEAYRQRSACGMPFSLLRASAVGRQVGVGYRVEQVLGALLGQWLHEAGTANCRRVWGRAAHRSNATQLPGQTARLLALNPRWVVRPGRRGNDAQ